MKDIRDEDSGIDYWLGLSIVLIILTLIFHTVPFARLATVILTSVLIIYLTFKEKGFRAFKIGIGIFFLIVLWSIYLNLIPY